MTRKEITFENGNRALVVTASGDTDAQSILEAIRVTPMKALMLLFGGASGLDDSRRVRLAELFSHAIARAAGDLNAVVTDGGTHSGVMAIMGEAVARDGRRCRLLGIAPAGKVTYPGGPAPAGLADAAPLDPNHEDVRTGARIQGTHRRNTR
jgi:predicted Rossmann-fold nucleotide-binding protein